MVLGLNEDDSKMHLYDILKFHQVLTLKFTKLSNIIHLYIYFKKTIILICLQVQNNLRM